MRKSLVSSLLFVLCSALSAQTSDVRKAIQDGVLTAEAINKLTIADVPKEWQSMRSVIESQTNTTITFTRDGEKVLEVTWSKKWTETKSHWFAGVVYKDGEKVAKIIRTKGVIVLPTSSASKIIIGTEVSDRGAVIVSVLEPNGNLIDSVVVDGRNTRLMDDLEFTKAKIAEEQVIRPMMEAMGAGLRDGVKQQIESK